MKKLLCLSSTLNLIREGEEYLLVGTRFVESRTGVCFHAQELDGGEYYKVELLGCVAYFRNMSTDAAQQYKAMKREKRKKEIRDLIFWCIIFGVVFWSIV